MTSRSGLGVVLFGGVGAVLRFLVDRAVSSADALALFRPALSWSTSAGTVCSASLSGLVLSPHLALLAGTAFVGSYTTFSTWMLETQRLGEERQFWPAFANIVVSLWAGLAAAALGHVDREPRCDDDYLKLTAYFGERLAARRPLPLRRPAGSLRRATSGDQRCAARHRQLRPAPRNCAATNR